MSAPEPVIPGDMTPSELPDLLRHWFLGSKARRHLSRRRFREVTELVRGAGRGRALDAGCGWGYNLYLLAREGFEPFGIDIVQNDFAAARRVARANGIEISLAGADLSALPFAAETFEAVTAVETLEHVFEEDRSEAFAEVWRVLSPGGFLALSTPNYHSIVEAGKRLIVRFPLLKRFFPAMCYPAAAMPRAQYHPYRYHKPIAPRELRAMLAAAGFGIVRMKRIVFVWKNVPDALFPLARLVESMLERVPLARRLASTLVVLAVKVERSGEGFRAGNE